MLEHFQAMGKSLTQAEIEIPRLNSLLDVAGLLNARLSLAPAFLQFSGWDEGIPQMKLGETALLECSPDYAYGSRGFGSIVPYFYA